MVLKFYYNYKNEMLDNTGIQMCLKKNRNKYHHTDIHKHQDLQGKLNVKNL